MASEQQPAEGATLTWGVKQSFRSYVEAVGGEIETAAGADRAPDGAFTFAAGPDGDLVIGPDGKPEGTARFTGEVRFKAHGGMLNVFLADPALEIGQSGAALTVADTPARNRRIEIAHLDLAAATTGADGEIVIPTAVTMDGYFLLGDHYPPKTPLDPVRLMPAGEH